MTDQEDPNPNLLPELCSAIFNTEQGKKLMKELKKHFLDIPIWMADQPEHMIYFREGQRHLILGLIEASKYKLP